MNLQHLVKNTTKSNKIAILTLAEFDNNFPQSFSTWCAGALEAQGYQTHIITLGWLTDLAYEQSLTPEKIKPTSLSANKIIFVLPEHNGMLPINLNNLTTFLPFLPKYETGLLITIVINPENQLIDTHIKELFIYSIHKLDAILGLNLAKNHTQIQNSIDGSMCGLFKENYSDLASIIEKIVKNTA